MSMFVIIMVAWLSKDGYVVAHNEGVAVDVEHCAAIASKSIADDIANKNPAIEGARPVISCWDTRDVKKPPHVVPEGSTEL